MVDSVVKRFVHKKISGIPANTPNDVVRTVDIRYCSQMHDNYRLDERILRQIITSCVKVKDRLRHRLSFSIYYKDRKSHSLIMKNSPRHASIFQCTNVVYKFTCPAPHDVIATYIGQTRTTLSRRVTMHLQGGSITTHSQLAHNTKLNRQTLVDNTVILHHEADPSRLKIAEALYIVRDKPILNVQDDHFGRTLKLLNNRHHLQCHSVGVPQGSSSAVAPNTCILNDHALDRHGKSPCCDPVSCAPSTGAMDHANLIEICGLPNCDRPTGPPSASSVDDTSCIEAVRLIEQCFIDPSAICRPSSDPVNGDMPQASPSTVLPLSPFVTPRLSLSDLSVLRTRSSATKTTGVSHYSYDHPCDQYDNGSISRRGLSPLSANAIDAANEIDPTNCIDVPNATELCPADMPRTPLFTVLPHSPFVTPRISFSDLSELRTRSSPTKTTNVSYHSYDHPCDQYDNGPVCGPVSFPPSTNHIEALDAVEQCSTGLSAMSQPPRGLETADLRDGDGTGAMCPHLIDNCNITIRRR